MTVTFPIGVEDIAATARYIASINPKLKWHFRRLQLLCAIVPNVLLLVLLLMNSENGLQFQHVTLQIGSLILIYAFAKYFFQAQYVRQVVAHTLKQNPNALTEMTCTIQSDGVMCSTPQGSNLLRWVDIKAVEQDMAYIYLVLSEISAVLIPKKTFKDGDEFDAFMGRLRKYKPTN